MTTLAAGSSVTLSVGDGGYVIVATNGGMASVTVTPTGGSASTVNLGPLPVRQRFGPYSEGASIVLSNSTAVLDYDYSGGDGPSLTAAQVAAVGAWARTPASFLSNGTSISDAYVDGPSPWVRLAGPSQFSAAPWSYSAELTTPSAAAVYTSAASPSNGPCMFRREGASIMIDGKVLVDTNALTYGNIRTFASGLEAGALAGKTIALLVYCHRLAATSGFTLRIGTSASNYVSYTWSVPRTNVREGWNLLICHTGEPVGASAAPNGSVDFESSGLSTTCWTVVGSGFDFSAGAPAYIAIDMTVVSNNCRLWVEGLYYGGRDKPRITLGFDIQGSGLSVAQAIMARYGLGDIGYAAVPSANANPSNPQFLWTAADIDRLQALYGTNNWDIMQHSTSHNSLGTLTDDGVLLCEMDANRQQIALMGAGSGASMFPTPNSSVSNRVIAAAAKLGVQWMRQGAGPGSFISRGLVGLNNPLAEGSFGMSGTYVLSNANAIARILAFVDLQILFGTTGHLFTHAVLAAGNASTSVDLSADVFEPVCAGIAARRDAGLLEPVSAVRHIQEGAPAARAFQFAIPNRHQVYPGASPYDLINVGYAPVRMLISGGTVSAITYSRDGSTFDATGLTAGSFELSPGDRLRITYTVAPTIMQYSV